jgi:iron complex transport system permease protein
LPLREADRVVSLWVLILILCAVFLLSLGIGRYYVPPFRVLQALLGTELFPGVPGGMINVVLNVRLPRLIAAALVGSSLALAGACFQGLFKNPLVSPGILGVSHGAGTGAALAIILGLGAIWINLFAFGFGLLAVMAAYAIKKFYKSENTLILILGGIIIGGFFSSLISLITYTADPYDTLPDIVYWLMGSLTGMTYVKVGMVAIPVIVFSGVLIAIRWRFNIMSLGDVEAQSLGMDTKRMQKIIIVSATTITASVVCISGTIGWIGLVVPHLARMLIGVDHTKLLPASAVLGAIVLIVIDDLARIAAGVEIPLGILTGLLGAPFFTYLLFRQKAKVA